MQRLDFRRNWYRIVFALFAALIILTPSLAPVQVEATSYFSNLSFSDSKDGASSFYFAPGTPEIFARWNYSYVPANSQLLRQWYHDGKLYIQKQAPWDSAMTGNVGTISSISIFDRVNGLAAGSYHVDIMLLSATNTILAQLYGDFTVGDFYIDGPSLPNNPPTTVPNNPPTTLPRFYALQVSDQQAGGLITTFPAGAPQIFTQWGYSNMPLDATMRRQWYVNGTLYRQVDKPWDATLGQNGTVTNISIYDHINGLPSGDWRLVVSSPNYPTAHIEVYFIVGPVPADHIFYNLTFSNAPDGLAISAFSAGTKRVYPRWTFQNVPAGAVVVRQWFRNGQPYIAKQDNWTFGSNGLSTQNFSIYDLDNGLQSGDYYVEISLLGVPTSLIPGYFTIF